MEQQPHNPQDYQKPQDVQARQQRFQPTEVEQSVQNIPLQIKGKFNWGAFFLTFFWSIFNKSFKKFLRFLTIPIVISIAMSTVGAPSFILDTVGTVIGIIIAYLFGKNGNEWAWTSKQWASIEVFEKVQTMWAKVGTIFAVIGIVIWLLSMPILGAMGLFNLSR